MTVADRLLALLVPLLLLGAPLARAEDTSVRREALGPAGQAQQLKRGDAGQAQQLKRGDAEEPSQFKPEGIPLRSKMRLAPGAKPTDPDAFGRVKPKVPGVDPDRPGELGAIPSVPAQGNRKRPGPTKYDDITLKRGITREPGGPEKAPHVFQNNQTNLEFLNERAKRPGYEQGRPGHELTPHEATHTVQQDEKAVQEDER